MLLNAHIRRDMADSDTKRTSGRRGWFEYFRKGVDDNDQCTAEADCTAVEEDASRTSLLEFSDPEESDSISERTSDDSDDSDDEKDTETETDQARSQVLISHHSLSSSEEEDTDHDTIVPPASSNLFQAELLKKLSSLETRVQFLEDLLDLVSEKNNQHKQR